MVIEILETIAIGVPVFFLRRRIIDTVKKANAYWNREEELFDGCPKPSGILAGMVAARLLSDDFKPKDNTAVFKGFTVKWLCLTDNQFRHTNNPRLKEAIADYNKQYKDTKNEGYYRDSFWKNFREHVNAYLDRLPVVTVVFDGLDVSFSEAELKKIEAALNKGLAFHTLREKNKDTAENQKRAVDAIEAFFKPVTGE